MRSYTALFTAILLLAGCQSEPVTGHLSDGLTGKAMRGSAEATAKSGKAKKRPLAVVATATGEVSMACQKTSATVGPDGAFSFEGLCLDKTDYRLSTNDKELWLADVNKVDKESSKAPLALKAWRAPAGSGVYKLSGKKLKTLKTASDVKASKLLGKEELVRSPNTIPNKPTQVGADDYIVITGADNIKNLQIIPLLKTGERKFGDPKDPTVVQPWSYIGVSFKTDTEYERVRARLKKDAVTKLEKGKRAAMFVPGAALPMGRYVLMGKKDRRAFIFDVVPGKTKDGKAGKAGKAGGKAGKKPGKSPDEPKRGGKSGKSGKKK